MAQIVLTQAESELYFYNALCNAVGTGYMEQMSLELCFDQNQYETAKQHLIEQGKTGMCYEDVLMQILKDGNTLTLLDQESDDEYKINLSDVHTKVSKTPFSHLTDTINEQDDAETASVILQTVFCGEVMYG